MSAPSRGPGPNSISRRLADRVRAARQILLHWGLLAAISVAIVWWIAPQQIGVLVYDLSKISLGALLGFLVDISTFPQARPEIGTLLRRYLTDLHRDDDVVLLDTQLALHSLRRAILIGGGMVALCLAP